MALVAPHLAARRDVVQPTREVPAMHRMHSRVLALLLAVAAVAAPAMALAKDAVTVALRAHKVTEQKGREVLVDAQEAKPGEVIEYRATYTNRSAESVREVWATLPIPAGLELQLPSVAPSQLLASTDGRTFAPVPLMRRERDASGAMVMRAVPASEYRSLRWSLGTLPAKGSRTVVARARVADAPLAASVR